MSGPEKRWSVRAWNDTCVHVNYTIWGSPQQKRRLAGFGWEGLVSAGFRGGRTCFGWFQGGKDWFRLVSGWEGLVSDGFVWEGLVSGGFGSFCFLVTTHN